MRLADVIRTLKGLMEITSCQDQGREGERIEDVAHIYSCAGRLIIRGLMR